MATHNIVLPIESSLYFHLTARKQDAVTNILLAERFHLDASPTHVNPNGILDRIQPIWRPGWAFF